MLTAAKHNQAPTKVVIIRHASKLQQSNPGVALDAIGQVLAMSFGNYYLKHYGYPDVVIATKASNNPDKPQSLRAQQTVCPLMTLLAEQNCFPVFQHEHPPKDYQAVANDILGQYQGKQILVCWEHHRINDLASALGVDIALPKWEKEDYNCVYELEISKNKTTIKILKNQYHTSFDGTYNDILQALEGLSLNTSKNSSDNNSHNQELSLLERPEALTRNFHLVLRCKAGSDEVPLEDGKMSIRHKQKC